MDIPSSTPRGNPQRNPQRNLPHPDQQYYASNDRHPMDPVGSLSPPLIRSTNRPNQSWDPQPSDEWNTPQSSPTKSSGSAHLSELFDRNLQLTPTPGQSPTKTPQTPSKRATGLREEDLAASVVRGHGQEGGVGRPLRPRRIKKENVPGEEPTTNLHRRSRVEPSSGYNRSTRGKYDPFRDMTVDEIEKLSKPSVKRLKDVAHLCMYPPFDSAGVQLLIEHRLL